MEVAGDIAPSDDVQSTANYDGSDARSFQVSGCQTDSLMTDWSQRYQQRYVNLILKACPGDGRCVLCDSGSVAVLSRNEVISKCDISDELGGHEFI